MIIEVLRETIHILAIVFVLMTVIEYIELRTQKCMSKWMTRGPLRQYLLASFLGATPGCVGAFASVSLYVHGFLNIGAITACMISTSGDEAFVMLAKFPVTALALFILLFVLGILGGFLMDLIVRKFGITRDKKCVIKVHRIERERTELRHFVKEHVFNHIIKQHLPKLFAWLLGALLVIRLIPNLEPTISHLPLPLLIFFAAVVGLVPGSGPHLPFVLLYADGAIPFSVLLTSSVVQDGHGMLPLLSYTIRDSVLVKTFNVVFGLLVGIAASLVFG